MLHTFSFYIVFYIRLFFLYALLLHTLLVYFSCDEHGSVDNSWDTDFIPFWSIPTRRVAKCPGGSGF